MAGVSVVIPAFNPGRLLDRALRSVMAQTFDDWDCIVVDDGGQEDVSRAASLDPRITVRRQENLGVSAARNAGADVSTSRWIAFLDQDDEWLPAKLEHQLAALDHAGSWSYTAFWWVADSGKRRGEAVEPVLRSFLAGGHISLSSLVVARDVLQAVGGFDRSYAQQQDAELFARLLDRGEPAAVVDEPLVRTHVHGQNTSSDYRRALAERLRLLERYDMLEAAPFWRHVYGTQAFDAFRRTRSPRALAEALRWSPGYTFKALLRRLM